MNRRRLIMLLAPSALLHPQEAKGFLRGRLAREAAKPPVLITRDGRRFELEGDSPTLAVLRDARIPAEDYEVLGQVASSESFRIEPIHERAMFVHVRGKRLVITYWCGVCSIRSFAPGKCVCCQEETRLDLRDPALKDTDPS